MMQIHVIISTAVRSKASEAEVETFSGFAEAITAFVFVDCGGQSDLRAFGAAEALRHWAVNGAVSVWNMLKATGKCSFF